MHASLMLAEYWNASGSPKLLKRMTLSFRAFDVYSNYVFPPVSRYQFTALVHKVLSTFPFSASKK